MSRRLAVIMVLIVACLGVLHATDMGAGHVVAESSTWPLRVEYEFATLSFDQLDSELARAEYVFSGNSWSDWRNERVSGESRNCMVKRPDGAMLEGPAGCSKVTEFDRLELGQPAMPNDYLRMRGIAELRSAGAVVDRERAQSVAQRLGVLSEDVSSLTLTTAASCASQGLSECRGAGPLPFTRSSAWHQPSGIMLEMEERLDGTVVRNYRATDVEFLKSFD